MKDDRQYHVRGIEISNVRMYFRGPTIMSDPLSNLASAPDLPMFYAEAKNAHGKPWSCGKLHMQYHKIVFC